METVVKAEKLRKVYITHKKEPGLVGSIKSLVKRRYLYVEAVKGVSFSINMGEFVGYIGPNGAGKTTTLKLLSGLLYPTSGKATVLGFIPWQRKDAFKRKISFVMGQKTQLWWDLPAMESFLLNKEIYQIPQKTFDGTIDYLSSLLEVKNLLNIPVRNLSLGERMKMELIGSLLHNPEVLFLDEPTIGLDVISQKKIRNFLKEYNKTQATTIILTSHYMRDVEDLCKRVIVINKGNIVFDGTLSELTQVYTKNKLLKLTFSERVPEEIENFGKVVSQDELKIILEVNREIIAHTSEELLRRYKIEDITIKEIPIEDVISEIFSSKQNAQ